MGQKRDKKYVFAVRVAAMSGFGGLRGSSSLNHFLKQVVCICCINSHALKSLQFFSVMVFVGALCTHRLMV